VLLGDCCLYKSVESLRNQFYNDCIYSCCEGAEGSFFN
jgi:hypothetical protein